MTVPPCAPLAIVWPDELYKLGLVVLLGLTVRAIWRALAREEREEGGR